MITTDWRKVKVKEERNVMLKRALITRVLAICGGVTILMTLVITVGCFCFGITLRYVTNLTDPGRPMVIQAYYLYDVTKSPQTEITLFMQMMGVTVSGLCFTAVDNLLGLLVLHICGQMENLHVRLKNLGRVSDFKAVLKFNVEDHIRLIRFSRIREIPRANRIRHIYQPKKSVAIVKQLLNGLLSENVNFVFAKTCIVK